MAQIEAKDTYIYISTDDGATYKKVICLTDAGVSSSKTTTDTDTRCGVLTATGNSTVTFTGTGVVDDSPDADELSHNEMWALNEADTTVDIVFQNELGTIFLGGKGKITDISDTATQGQFVTFQFTLKISGNLSQSHVS